jgi:hypothetical protein
MRCRNASILPIGARDTAAKVVHQQVAGLLGHPRAHGVSGNPGQVHAPGAVLDEEQHVQAAQEHRIDVEEVAGEDRLGLAGQERPPGLPGAPGCGIDTGVLEDLPHRRRRDLISQAGTGTPTSGCPAPSPAPARVWPAGAAPAGLTPPDQPGVPAQHGTRRDDQLELAEATAGYKPGQRGQDCAVGPGQLRCLDLALEDGDLVAQDEDLSVARSDRASRASQPNTRNAATEVPDWRRDLVSPELPRGPPGGTRITEANRLSPGYASIGGPRRGQWAEHHPLGRGGRRRAFL